MSSYEPEQVPQHPPHHEEQAALPFLRWPFQGLQRTPRTPRSHRPHWWYAVILTLCLSTTLFVDVIGNMSTASAASTTQFATKLPVASASNTLGQFLKQGGASHGAPGTPPGPANYPALTHGSNPGPSTSSSNASQAAKPSAEPPSMKVVSQVLSASFLSAPVVPPSLAPNTVGNVDLPPSLHLAGSDGNGTRMEVDIPAGALDFSAAYTSANSRPQGNLTLTLTQTHGHYVTATKELSAYAIKITDAQGQAVYGTQLRLPFTYTFHYRANELFQMGIDPDQVYLVLTPASTSSAVTTPAVAATDGVPTPAAPANTTTLLLTNNAATSTLSATSTVLAAAASVTSGPDAIQNPPKARFASVQGNTGAISYSYPLVVAPGPIGTTPTLAVSYSSATTNARHTPNSPAGPVGDGWNLTMGEITSSQDSSYNTWYSLNGVDGISDRLIPNKNNSGSVYTYQTEHISYMKIERVDPPSSGSTTGQHYFLVWDKAGNEYEFGNTPDSLEYYTRISGSTSTQMNYTYALDKIILANEGPGTNNRVVNITYVQDKESRTVSGTTYTWIRDFGLKRITYGTISNGNTTLAGTVDFFYNGPTTYTDSSNNVQYITAYTSTYQKNCGTLPATPPQIQRCDDPIDRTVSGTGYPDPDVMSTLELTSVKSYVGSDSSISNLDYSYAFGYSDTAFTTCPTADTTMTNYYCAGNHLLTSITPTVYQNSGGTSTGHTLAGMTFSYTTPRTNKYDDSDTSYHMENAWEYLSSYHDHSSGVGASITYHTAYNNTKGTPYNSGDNRYDTFYCAWSSSNCPSSSSFYPFDNKAWTQQAVYEIDSQGKDSSASSITAVSNIYRYWLNKTNNSNPCAADSQGTTDCVGYTWIPDTGNSAAAANYYDGEFRGFGTVLAYCCGTDPTNVQENLTVQKYASTYGFNAVSSNVSLATDARNYLGGSLLEEDVFSGPNATCSKLLTQTLNNYAGEAVQTQQQCGTSPFSSTPTSCSNVYTFTNNSPAYMYAACKVELLSTRTIDWEGTGVAGPYVQHDYTYDDYRSSGTTTGLGSFYAAPATGSYGNMQQEVITGSNLPTATPTVTKKLTYYTNDQTVNGYVYYNVSNVAHSEVDDNSGTYLCSDATYDEGVASGVPTPSQGLPTTVTTYSSCGNSSSAIKNYAGYDTDGNPVVSVDGVGTANPGLYSSSGGCTLPSSSTLKFMASAWTAGRFTSCSAYSAANAQVTDTWDAFSHHTQTTYDATQGLLPTSVVDANGQTTNTIYNYDTNGNPIVQVKEPSESGTYTQQSTITTSCTDSSIYPCMEVDSNSLLYNSAPARVFYDSMGREVEKLTPGPGSNYTTVSFVVYNDSNRSVFQSQPIVLAARTTWLDPNDSSVASLAGATTYNDADGRTIATMDALFTTSSGITCPSLTAETASWTTPLTKATTCIIYGDGTSGVSGDSNTYDTITDIDANNHVSIAYTDALGHTIYSVADSGVYSGTLTPVRRTTMAYNVLDKPTSVTVTDLAPQSGQSIIGVVTTAGYDSLGRMIGLGDPDRGNHTYFYDANGNAIGDVTGSGANQRAVGSKYDLLGRVGCVQNSVPALTDVDMHGACSSGATPYVQNTYDADPSGVPWSSNYPVGKLTQSVTTTTYPAPDNAIGTVTENYQYDQRGRPITKLMQIVVSGGSIAFPTFPVYQETLAYNDINQPTTTQTTVGGQAGYTFTQVYDSTTGVQAGLSNTTTASTSLAAFSYNNYGLVSDILLKDSSSANLADKKMLYDGDLRPASTTTTWSSSGSIIYSDNVSYDNIGNVLSRATTHAAVPGVSGSGGSEVQNFCYDEQGHMVWASNASAATSGTGQTCGTTALQTTLGGSYTNQYVYTHLGQLWQGPLNGSGTQEQYLYCNTSQPHQVTALSPKSGSPTCAAPGTPSYQASYDAYGNMTSRIYPSTADGTIVYDTADRMVRWSGTTSTGVNGEWYLYDASGSRVLRRSASTVSGGNPATSASTITVYAFGLEEHVYSYTGSGSSATNTGNTYYYSLAGQLIGTYNGTSTSFMLTDLLGSVVSTISNTAGSAAVLGNQIYGPYGNQRYAAGSIGTAKGFTGQYNDGLTGLNYYNARYYDPVSGRFLSADTVQNNLGGADPYGYVGGSPETKNDPTGHRSGDPGGLYLFMWYAAIHPDDFTANQISTDNIPNSGRGPKIGGVYPDIINNNGGGPQSRIRFPIVWEGKSGAVAYNKSDDTSLTYAPTSTGNGGQQIKNATDNTGYTAGTINNDPRLEEWFNECGHEFCQFEFPDGTIMTIQYPDSATPGILKYQIDKTAPGDPALAIATDIQRLQQHANQAYKNLPQWIANKWKPTPHASPGFNPARGSSASNIAFLAAAGAAIVGAAWLVGRAVEQAVQDLWPVLQPAVYRSGGNTMQ